MYRFFLVSCYFSAYILLTILKKQKSEGAGVKRLGYIFTSSLTSQQPFSTISGWINLSSDLRNRIFSHIYITTFEEHE